MLSHVAVVIPAASVSVVKCFVTSTTLRTWSFDDRYDLDWL